MRTGFSVVLIIASSAVLAQEWEVRRLGLAPGENSYAHCVNDAVVGGSVQTLNGPFTQTAAIWSQQTQTWTYLLPPGGIQSSRVMAAAGDQQVGYLDGPSFGPSGARAYLWHGTSESRVQLRADGFNTTLAMGTDGDRQVGHVYNSGQSFGGAALWNDTSESFVFLGPPGTQTSTARAILGHRQVGDVEGKAAVWHGTAESYVDLNPDGAERSGATTLNETHEGGYAFFNGMQRAAMWSGSKDSFVDMHPDGASSSLIRGLSGNYQVGSYVTESADRAILWQGSADSYIDLHDLLPWTATRSVATGIVGVEGGNVLISGHVDSEAVIWMYRPVPEPSTLICLGLGALLLGRRRGAAKH